MVCFCTNIWNHHQGPVCRELARLLGDQFRLIVYQPLDCEWSQERVRMGWNLNPPDEPWIIGPPTTEAELRSGDFFRGLIESADVLVYGSNRYFDMVALNRRLVSGKLTFRCGERLHRAPIRWTDFLSLRFLHHWYLVHREFAHPALHYLTMSHWCLKDLRFFRACRGRIWRWGYLVDVTPKPVRKCGGDKVRIGWCGRMMRLKNVDYILRAFAGLPDSVKGQAVVELVGEGEDKGRLRALAKQLDVDGQVVFRGMIPHCKALEFLEKIDIFIFPSGMKEGWGAVLGEAMDKCCAVIANTEAGSTLELVRDGVNGYVFSGDDLGTLSRRMEELIVDGVKRMEFGMRAWQTMQEWSPMVGAKKLVGLVRQLQIGAVPIRGDGLCSWRG